MARYVKSGTVNTVQEINSELEKIATAQDEFLTRNGEAPNEMKSTLDMNGKRITNLPSPLSLQEPLRLADVANVIAGDIVLDSEIKVFDNIAEMKLADLSVGQTVRCNRYYNGGELVADLNFVVAAGGIGVDDGGSFHDLDNGNQVQLICSDSLNVAQFGVVGDGIEDDVGKLNSAITFANTSSVFKITGDSSKTYLFQDVIDFTGLSNIEIDFGGASIIDDVQTDIFAGGVERRGSPLFLMYNANDITVKNFSYTNAATRNIGTNPSAAPAVVCWVGGQFFGSAISTNCKMENITAESRPSSGMMFIFVAGEQRGSEFTNIDLSGDWAFGVNFEFGASPVDPSIETNPIENGKYPYNGKVTNFNGTNLYNCLGFLRTGGAYNVIFENCQGVNVSRFIDCTGGDKNNIRGAQTTRFINCNHLTDLSNASFLATSIVAIAMNNEQFGAPLPSYINLDHQITFENCSFEGNDKVGSNVIRHVGNQGKTTFRSCQFSKGTIGLITGPSGNVTYNSDRALSFYDCDWKDLGQIAALNNETGVSFIRNKFKGVTNATATPLQDGGTISGGHSFEDCLFGDATGGLISNKEWYRSSSLGTSITNIERCTFNLFAGGTLPAIKAEFPLTGSNNRVIGGSGVLSTPTASRFQVKGDSKSESMNIALLSDQTMLEADRALTYVVLSGTRSFVGTSGGEVGDIVTVINQVSAASTTFVHASVTPASNERFFTNTGSDVVLTTNLNGIRFQKSVIGWHQI